MLSAPTLFHNPILDLLSYVYLGSLLYVSGMSRFPPSPQPQDNTDEKLHTLRKYARDFRHQHTKDARDFDWDSDDEDYGLVIGHLVVT
jgi:hypothetical protein